MQVLRNTTPTARKEHACMFCGGIIAVGEKYDRQTNNYKRKLRDWVCHCECFDIVYKLDMFDYANDCIDSDKFIQSINRYVYDNHYDDEICDIAEDWQLPYPELVKKVLEELKKEKNQMKAITIKQPWSSLIVHGIKDIENRAWPCPKKYIGQRVLIRASATPVNMRNPSSVFTHRQWDFLTEEQKMLTISGAMPTSSIIGSVEIADCTFNHPSIWAEKSKGISVCGHVTDEKEPIIYNWVLANPILFANPIPAKGKLSFWNYPGVIEEGGNQ